MCSHQWDNLLLLIYSTFTSQSQHANMCITSFRVKMHAINNSVMHFIASEWYPTYGELIELFKCHPDSSSPRADRLLWRGLHFPAI